MSVELNPGLEEPLSVPPDPPTQKLPPGQWIRANLFNNALNTVLTLVFGVLIAVVLFRVLRFVFVSGRWDVVQANLLNFMVGRFARAHLDRLWAAIYIGALLFGIGGGLTAQRLGSVPVRISVKRALPLLFGLAVLLQFTRSVLPTLLVLGAIGVMALGRVVGARMPLRAGRKMPLVYLAAVVGCYFLLVSVVPLQLWGGLLLTVTVAAAGILLSFPFGVLLGLGRRSSFPVFRMFSVLYIETIRGVPLITLLFIGSVTIGLFLPPDAGRMDLVVRALVAIVLFSAAYMAETVRGGLQSVPRGQTEAAMAIGLSPMKTTALIVLPQALRNVIPTIVGQFISLWKDTSLLAGIGLLEILGITQAVLVQEEFRGQGLQGEVFAFAAFLYWTACYSMSRASQRLEARLGVGER